MTEMDLQVRSLRTTRFVLFVFSIMTWYWGYMILSSIRDTTSLAFLLPGIVSLPLLIGAIIFSRRLRGLSGVGVFANRRAFGLYLLIVFLTLACFVAALIVAGSLGHLEWIIPAGMVIIGLHFLAFIPILHDRFHAIFTCAVYCLTAVLVPLLIHPTTMLGSLYLTPLASYHNRLVWLVIGGTLCWACLLGQYIYMFVVRFPLATRLVRGQAEPMGQSLA